MIEFGSGFNDEGRFNNIIYIVDDVRKLIISDNKVLTVPTKLPMITPPKLYKLKKNGDITLGDFLNNDILFTLGLFIENPAYTLVTFMDLCCLEWDNLLKICYTILQSLLRRE